MEADRYRPHPAAASSGWRSGLAAPLPPSHPKEPCSARAHAPPPQLLAGPRGQRRPGRLQRVRRELRAVRRQRRLWRLRPVLRGLWARRRGRRLRALLQRHVQVSARGGPWLGRGSGGRAPRDGSRRSGPGATAAPGSRTSPSPRGIPPALPCPAQRVPPGRRRRPGAPHRLCCWPSTRLPALPSSLPSGRAASAAWTTSAAWSTATSASSPSPGSPPSLVRPAFQLCARVCLGRLGRRAAGAALHSIRSRGGMHGRTARHSVLPPRASWASWRGRPALPALRLTSHPVAATASRPAIFGRVRGLRRRRLPAVRQQRRRGLRPLPAQPAAGPGRGAAQLHRHTGVQPAAGLRLLLHSRRQQPGLLPLRRRADQRRRRRGALRGVHTARAVAAGHAPPGRLQRVCRQRRRGVHLPAVRRVRAALLRRSRRRQRGKRCRRKAQGHAGGAGGAAAHRRRQPGGGLQEAAARRAARAQAVSAGQPCRASRDSLAGGGLLRRRPPASLTTPLQDRFVLPPPSLPCFFSPLVSPSCHDALPHALPISCCPARPALSRAAHLHMRHRLTRRQRQSHRRRPQITRPHLALQ